jgi:hypothetical protein
MNEDTRAGTDDSPAQWTREHREGGYAKTGDPRCDYVPRPGDSAYRCRRPAAMRVLYRHGTGVDPCYRERCLLHAAEHLGPKVAALWDPLKREWVGTD